MLPRVEVSTKDIVVVALETVVGNGSEVGCPEVSREVCAVPLVLWVMEMVADCTADVVNEVNELFGTLVVVVVVDVSLMTCVIVEVSPAPKGELTIAGVWLDAEMTEGLDGDALEELGEGKIEELVAREIECKLEGLDEPIKDERLVKETSKLDDIELGWLVEILGIVTIALELFLLQAGQDDVDGEYELDHHLGEGVNVKLVVTDIVIVVSALLVGVISSVQVICAVSPCPFAIWCEDLGTVSCQS